MFALYSLDTGQPVFAALHRGVEGLLGGARDLRLQLQVALRDGKAVGLLFQGDGAHRFDALGLQIGAGQLRGKRHREAAGMRGGEQFLRIRALALFEARLEGVR